MTISNGKDTPDGFAQSGSTSPDIKPDVGMLDFNHLPKNVCPTFCVVCGDKAAGYHYDVPSCNGCKTFFRRTVLDQRNFTCKKGGRCFEILPKERRCSCRACRFQRCVEVGMNPLAIQTDKNLQSNEMFRSLVSKRKTTDAEELEEPPRDSKILMELRLKENTFERLIEGLQYLEIKIGGLKAILKKHSALSQADNLGPMPDWPLKPLPPFDPSHGCKPCQDPVRQAWLKMPNRKNWFFFDLLMAVEYTKTFEFFSQLDESDKVILTRYVSLMLLGITQSFYSFLKDHDAQYVVHPDGTRPGQVWAWKKENFWNSIRPMMETVFASNLGALRNNKVTHEEYVLIKAIILTNSAIEGLTEHGSKIIETARQKYSEALFSLQMAKLGAVHGPARFQELLSIVQLLIRTARKHRECHLLHNVTKPATRRAPMVEEIMDA
ncbi:unnamed protein product, partial [Mesorhabditis spiculigera]